MLCLGAADDPWIAGSLTSFARLGIACEPLTGEAAARRFPMLDAAKVGHAIWTGSGGVLLARAIVTALAGWLRRQGVTVREGAPVAALDPARASVRLASGETVAGDALVVAAGPWVDRLVPALRGRVVPSRQVLVYAEPPPELADAWRRAPMITDVLTGDTGVFYAVPPVAGTPLKLGDHRFSRAGDPDSRDEPGIVEIEALFELVGRRLRAIGRYTLRTARTCYYDVTADERFVAAGEGPTLVIGGFSGHGFKFGAVIGERAAACVTGALARADLARWLAGSAAPADLSDPAALV
jgi:sarcosine oxidase subunit beta